MTSSHLKIKKQLISYHKFNEKKQLNSIIEHINKGKILSLISDAGTPLLSDPGRLLLNECLIREIKIVPIPGVSSIATAMSVSGFSDKFLFYGFLPKKLNELTKVLDVLSTYEYSQVFFVPALSSMICSVGIKISPNFSDKLFNIILSSKAALTFCS